jgi:hypothetical protein
MLLLASACNTEPDPLPTEMRVAGANARIDRAGQPALYQLLYDYAFLPEVQHREQRVRILIWLVHAEVSAYQLQSLWVLSQEVSAEKARIEEAQRAIVERYESEVGKTYDAIWSALRSGEALESEALESSAGTLLTQKLQLSRERELLELRVQGIQGIMEMEQSWLASLTPKQEILLADALFFLRHRLDPYANPGDFQSMIGSVFIAGDWGTLTRGTYDREKDHLNLGGLWSDMAIEELQGPVFNDLRRELVLYMILLEPALPDAIEAALALTTPINEPSDPPPPPEPAPE